MHETIALLITVNFLSTLILYLVKEHKTVKYIGELC